MFKTIFISFYNSYPITSGASSVTTNFFLNWPGKKKLFQINNTENKKSNIYNFKIMNNNKFIKFIFLIPYCFFIIKRIKNDNLKYVIFEGASWSGYIYITFKILKFFFNNTKYIYHSHNIDYFFRQENIIIKYLSFFFERQILKEFDISTCVSKADQTDYAKIFKSRTLIVPNGVGIEKKFLKRVITKKYILFSGSLEFKENKKIFMNLLNNEFLIIKKRIPGIRIFQTGGGDIKHFTKNKDIKELGTLKKKKYLKYLQEALMIVIPASAAPGTKIKIIESLCYNKIVLTTKHGLKGIGAKFNKLLVYSNLNQFKKKINYLKKINFNNSQYQKIGKTYRKKYNITNIIKNFYAEIKKY